MKLCIVVILLMGLLPCAPVRAEDGKTLKELLAKIETIPGGDTGLTEKEQAYIEALLKYEKEAIPELIKLLSHADKDVAEIAAAALGGCAHVDAKYLPQIIAGLDRDIGWLPRALGKIESPEAAKEAVKRYLLADSSPHNQEAYAVKLQGIRAVPPLIEAAILDNGKTEQVYYLLGHALEEMKPDVRKEAALSMIKIIDDEHSSVELVRGVLSLISCLKESGLVVEPEMLKLRIARPELKEAINQALCGIRSPESGKIYVGILKLNPDVFALRDLAEIGKPARDAGEEVAKLLKHPDWEIRRAAATTLGFIGYTEAAPALISLLTEASDVRMNLIAAKSLGRFQAKTAESPLREAAKNHWHPVVRKASEHSLEQISTTNTAPALARSSNFAFEFFGYDRFETESAVSNKLELMEESSSSKLYKGTSLKKIESLSYDSKIISYGANDEAEQRESKGKDGVIFVNKDNIVKHEMPIKQIPDVALRINEGWLVGSDRGEWGGELVIVQDNGVRIHLLDENIQDIFRLGEKTIVVAGLAHLSSNDGIIYEVKPGQDGKWIADPWRVLPGAPEKSGKTQSGEIFISTRRGGVIILSQDGKLRMASDH